VKIFGLGVRGESTLLSILGFPLPSTKSMTPHPLILHHSPLRHGLPLLIRVFKSLMGK
jgi:hypothetical protein